MTPRELLISGNWKMNENHYESLRLIQELAALLRASPLPSGRSLSVHPPYTSLRTVQVAIETDRVPLALGAQNCHAQERGAFTGEVSAEMLAKLGVSYVIVGHSERRRLAHETDEDIRKKIDAVLAHGMVPLLCVGEDAPERDEGRAEEVVRAQVRAAFSKRPSDVLGSAVIAYEPLWAVGTGTPAEPKDAEEMCALVRSEIATLDEEAALMIRIQYGGSVNGDNAAELLAEANVDGLLVGGASLDATSFINIARAGAA